MAKLLYSMGEVTEMFDVNASLIRYWESKFDCIKPHKNKKGNRMFTPSDVENLKLIYHLVKEKGMTLEGANKTLKKRGGSVKRDVSILDRLHNIRAMLVEVRESLGETSAAEYEAPIEAVSELISDVEAEAKSAVVEAATTPDAEVEEPVAEPIAEPAEQPVARRRGRPRKSVPVEEVKAEESPSEEAAQPTARRRGRQRKNEEVKELFPFYEQSLF